MNHSPLLALTVCCVVSREQEYEERNYYNITSGSTHAAGPSRSLWFDSEMRQTLSRFQREIVC